MQNISAKIKKLLKNKIVFSIIFILAFFVSVYNLVIVVTSPTDQNSFADTFSKIVVKETFPAKSIKLKNNTISDDSVTVNSFLVSINDIKVTTQNDLLSLLEDIKSNELKLELHNYQKDQHYQRIINLKDFNTEKFIYFNSALIVINVDKDGTSDKAGMQKWDIITKVNNEDFKDGVDATKHLNSKSVSTNLYYEIYRNGEFKTLDIKIAKYGISKMNLIRFIFGLLLFIFALRFIFKNKDDEGFNRIAFQLGYFFIINGLFLTFCQIKPVVFSPKFEVIRVVLLFYFYLSFIFLNQYIYTNLPNYFFISKPEKYLRTKNIAYLLLFIVVTIIITVQFSSGLTLLPLLVTVIFSIVFFGIDIKFGVIQIKKSSFSRFLLSANPAFIFIGTILYLLYDTSTSNYENEISLAITLLPVAILLIILNYYNKLELLLKVKKNVLYSLVTGLWQLVNFSIAIFALYLITNTNWNMPNLALRGLKIVVLTSQLNTEYEYFLEKIFVLILSFLVVIITWLLSRAVQNWIDNKFFRNSLDFESSSKELLGILEQKLALSHLAQEITNKLSSILKVKRIGVLFFKNEQRILEQNFLGFNDYTFKEYLNAIDTKLINQIKLQNTIFDIDNLDNDIKQVFKECKLNLISPIYSKGKLLGAIIIGEKLSETKFGSQDLQLISNISSQSSFVIENAFLYDDLAEKERYKHELEIARKIQLSSLPQDIPHINWLDLSGSSLPALEVGGDFYDFYQSDNKMTIALGDVSGKGTSAAFYMSKIQGILKVLSEFSLSPKNVLIRTNSIIYKYLDKNFFISCVITEFDKVNKTVTISRAGHLPVYWYNSLTEKMELILPDGIVLGVNKGILFDKSIDEVKVNYNSNDVFVMISDGIIEARNSSEDEFGEETLLKAINANHRLTANEIRNNILSQVNMFSKNKEQFDDITIVVVKAV